MYTPLVLAERLQDHDDTPTDDRVVVLRGVNWSDYQRLMQARGENPRPRLAYLEGQLEVMTPSRSHESIKSRIGCLVEVWCLEAGLDFSPYGSWTLEKEDAQVGLEPDECYVFGNDAQPTRPDLAIEVVWTSGGLRKLDIYAKLGVREVWFWRRGRISVHVLRGAKYDQVSASLVLAGIDMSELSSYLDRASTSQAIREYRAALLARQR